MDTVVELPQCVICRDDITPGGDVTYVTSLPCGHTFHTECITKYADCKGIDLERACPYRCNPVEVDLVNDDEMAPAPEQRDAEITAEMSRVSALGDALQ